MLSIIERSRVERLVERIGAEQYRPSARIEAGLLLLSCAFVAISGISFSLAWEERVLLDHLYPALIWTVLMAASYFVLRVTIPAHDPFILPIFALLTGWGLVLVDRLAPNFLARQVTWLAVSCASMLLVASYRPILGFLRRYRYTWLTLGLALLAATLLFGVNPSGVGATLWLRLPVGGGIYFQPSELLKLLIVVFLASYFADRGGLISLHSQGSARRWIAYLAPMGLMWAFCMVLLIWQRDLGAASLFFTVFVVLIYLNTGDWRYIAAGLLLIVLAGAIGYRAFDVVDLRVDTWINPWDEANSRGFQIVQSLYAVAAGGVLGSGVGLGLPTFIPVVHSDFVFAAVAEEWGLVGVFAVVASFAVLAYRGLRIAGRCRDAFGLYLAAGITVLFSVQAFLITAGVTKLVPLTGITLPFISYGGSSLLVSAVMIGLLLNISAGLDDDRQRTGSRSLRSQP